VKRIRGENTEREASREDSLMLGKLKIVTIIPSNSIRTFKRNLKIKVQMVNLHKNYILKRKIFNKI